jgi:hypothetical protein
VSPYPCHQLKSRVTRLVRQQNTWHDKASRIARNYFFDECWVLENSIEILTLDAIRRIAPKIVSKQSIFALRAIDSIDTNKWHECGFAGKSAHFARSEGSIALNSAVRFSKLLLALGFALARSFQIASPANRSNILAIGCSIVRSQLFRHHQRSSLSGLFSP